MFKRMLQGEKELEFLAGVARATNRRTFLQWSGITIGVVALGCSDDNGPPGTGTEVNLGTMDIGVLNYAYALEQLEAAFYSKVVTSFYTGASAAEQSILTDIKNHEVIHRDFLKAALGPNAIAELTVDFTSVNFTDRMSVLTTARTFEDLGVSAYNGAGQLLTNPDYLVVAGRIVSVEARHASAIRDLLVANSFANGEVVNSMGLDAVRNPTEVLGLADPFITNTINASGLPTS